MKRGSGNKTGEYHKVVHVWIKNSQGLYLIQQRNKATDRIPYQWAPTAGAVISGETPFDTALRETKEELGITIDKDAIKHLKTIFVDTSTNNFIIELYLVKANYQIVDLTIDPIEVKAIKYATETEIFQLINENLFWNFIKIIPDVDYFDILRKE